MVMILVAEGEGRSRRMLRRFLEGQGMTTRGASTLEEALAILREGRVDLTVMGLGAPAIRRLRAAGVEGPVLALLGRDTLEERRQAFGAGADCWLRRPVDLEELSLVLWAMARRWGGSGGSGGLEAQVLLGEARLEEGRRELWAGERRLGLTPREYGLLALMLGHPRRVFSRQELLDRLWGLESEAGPRAVDVVVRRLRLRCGAGWGFRIEAVRGVGYRLVQEEGVVAQP